MHQSADQPSSDSSTVDQLNATNTDLPDSRIAQAIFHTILYAAVFDFPLTEAEIHHFLIDVRAEPEDVTNTLITSYWLAHRIQCIDGYYSLRDQSSGSHRQESYRTAERLWSRAIRYGKLLAHLPFVRLVALTGSLAMRNPNGPNDDIDYMLVTVPGRVWITRALVVLIVKLARLRHVELCPNYVLAETALIQKQQNLFTAHELAQMIPIAGNALYQTMREANQWSMPLLPNAQAPFYSEPDQAPSGIGRLGQRLGELFLGGKIGDRLEAWEQQRKLRKFRPQLKTPNSSAILDQDQVKGHFNDHGLKILAQYQALLEKYDPSM